MRSFSETEIYLSDVSSNHPFAECLQGASRMEESVLHLLDVERLLASPKLRHF
jgi:hypothetical protein